MGQKKGNIQRETYLPFKRGAYFILLLLLVSLTQISQSNSQAERDIIKEDLYEAPLSSTYKEPQEALSGQCFPMQDEATKSSIIEEYSDFFMPTGQSLTTIVNLQFDLETSEDAAALDQLLEDLHASTILATFFFTENFAKEFPDTVSKVYERNHFLGLLVEEDISGMNYTEQMELFTSKLAALQAMSAEDIKIQRIKLKQLQQNPDTYYVLRDLEILQLTSLFNDPALCEINDKEFVGSCGYCQLVGGKIDHVYPTVYGFWAIPLTTIEKEGQNLPLSDEFLNKTFFDDVLETYEKTNATPDHIALRFITASLQPSTYTKYTKQFQEVATTIYKTKGAIKAFHENFTINAGGNHISQLSIVSYPDPVCGGQDNVNIRISYTSTLYCPTYYFRTYGKYPSETTWKKLEEHSEYVSTGVHYFNAIVNIPQPSRIAEDDSTYEILVLGQDCVSGSGPCWPTPTSYQRKAEASLKIPKLKPEIKGTAPYQGLREYEAAFKEKVFRRGSSQTLPRVEVTIEHASSIPEGGKLVIDLYKAKTEKYPSQSKARRLETPFVKKLSDTSYEGKWSDWKSSTGLWSTNADIPIGEYQAQAKVLIGGKELCLSKHKEFWVIYDTPSSLGPADEGAYLYDTSGSRDSKSIQYNDYSNKDSNLNKFLKWEESERYLRQFDAHLFNITLAAVDGQKKETTSAENLMNAVANVIYYTSPDRSSSVANMYAGVTREQFVDASIGKEDQLIRGQCLDYAHSLAAMYRGIGIPARVATDIEGGPKFDYHEWTEAFFDKPPYGADNWYVYDAMDYTRNHTPANDLTSPAQGSARRKNAPYGDNAYEIPIGKTNWISDGGVLWLNSTDKYIYRKNTQANDTLFTKCEEKKYDNASCTLPPFIKLDEIPLLELKLPEQSRVKELIPINVSINNIFADPLVVDLNLTIYRFAAGDDGRDAGNSGVLGEVIERITDQILVPANTSLEQTYSFMIDTTIYPAEAYFVEAILLNSSERLESDLETIDILPGFDLQPFFPSIYEEESFTATLQVTNMLDTTIQDISVLFAHPWYYQTQDPLLQDISSLTPGESMNLSWRMDLVAPTSEVERAFSFDVTSGNAGSQVLVVNHRVIRRATLELVSSVQKIYHSASQPFTSETKEISFFVLNSGDENATNVHVQLLVPGNVSAVPDTWGFVQVNAGERNEIKTDITTLSDQDFTLDLIASADQAAVNATIPGLIFSVETWSDSFDNSNFLNLSASENISVTEGKIVLVQGFSSGVVVSLPFLQETASWETFSWNSSESNTSIMFVSNDGVDWTPVENRQDISFLDAKLPLFWKYEMLDSGVAPELYDVTIVSSEKEPVGAELLGVFSDHGEDDDFDLKYDSLVVIADVNISVPGSYYLEGYLYDNESNLVSRNISKMTFNTKGINEFPLKFKGVDIAIAEYSGTFILELVELYDENTTQIDFRSDAYTTNSYDHDDFEAYALLQGYTKNITGGIVGGVEVSITGQATDSILSDNVSGYYSFKLFEGNYQIIALPDPYMNLHQSLTSVLLSSGEVRTLNFSLQQAGSVAGRVTDENGSAVTNVYIFEDVFEPPQYSTNASGHYIVPFLDPGQRNIRIDEGMWYIYVDGEFVTYDTHIVVNVTLGKTTPVDFSKQLPLGCVDIDNDGFYGNCPISPDCNDANSSWIGVKDDTVLTQDTFICPGTYQVFDAAHNGLFIFGIGNISLDCSNSVIKGPHAGTGIYAASKNDVHISNCYLEDFDEGIYLYFGVGATIDNVTTIGNDNYGVYLYGSDRVLIQNSLLQGNYRGIYGYSTDGTQMLNNSLSGNSYGIELYSTLNATIVDNRINDSYYYGLYLQYTDSNLIQGNYFNDSGSYDLLIDSSSDVNMVRGNGFWSTGILDYSFSTNYCGVPRNEFGPYASIPDSALICDCVDNDGDKTFAYNTTLCQVGNDCNDENASIIGLRDNLYLNRDVVMCRGGYNVSDKSTEGIIIFNATGITLDCNSSTIRGTRNGYGIYNTKNQNTIKNCNVEQYDYGLYLYNVNNGLLEHNRFDVNDYYGVYLRSSDNIQVMNVSARSNYYSGIYLYDVQGTTINKGLFENNGDYGIYLSSSHYNVLTNVLAKNNYDGALYLYSSDYNNITKSSFNESAYSSGAYFYFADFNRLEENSFTGNRYGVYASGTINGNAFFHNNIYNNTLYNFYNSQPINISAEYNWWGTNDSVQIANSIYDHYDYSYYGTLDFEPYLFSPYSANTAPSIDVTLSPLNATPDDDLICSGITSDAEGDVVSANYSITYRFTSRPKLPTFRNYPDKTANCSYLGTPGKYNCTALTSGNATSPNQEVTCTMTPYDGIIKGESDSAALLIGNGSQPLLGCGDSIVKDTVLTNNILNCSGNGLVIVADNITLDCNGFTLTGNDQGVDAGILLQNRSGVTVKNCTVHDFYYGIRLDGQNLNNLIVNNTFIRNSDGVNLYWYSGYNTIRGNNLSNNNFRGISLYSYSGYNTIEKNDITGNGDRGIWFYYHSDFNNVTGNRIIANQEHGARVYYDSKNNLFWNNSFINNPVNAAEEAGSTNNQWNVSNVGNRWSDFEQNIGYPNYYDISGPGNGKDWYPIVIS